MSDRLKQYTKDRNKDFSRHWCKYCKKYIDNRPLAIRHHENGSKHKLALEEWRKNRVLERRELDRKQREEDAVFRQIEEAARASYSQDMQEQGLAPPPPREPRPSQAWRPRAPQDGEDDGTAPPMQDYSVVFPAEEGGAGSVAGAGAPAQDFSQGEAEGSPAQPPESPGPTEAAESPGEEEEEAEDAGPSYEQLAAELETSRAGFLQLRAQFGDEPSSQQTEMLEKLQAELITLQAQADQAKEREERQLLRRLAREPPPLEAAPEKRQPEPEPVQIDPVTGLGMWQEVKPEESVFTRDQVSAATQERLAGHKRGFPGDHPHRSKRDGMPPKRQRSEAQALTDALHSSDDDESYLADPNVVAPPPALAAGGEDEPVIAFKKKKPKARATRVK